MVAISYTELVRRTPLWLYANNRTLVDEMPAIISEAEEQLLLVLDHDLFRTRVTLTIGDDTQPPAADSDLLTLLDNGAITGKILEVRAMRIRYAKGGDNERAWTPLMRRDNETMTMLYPAGRYARPKFYAEYGQILQYQFFPYPNMEYEIDITINLEPPRLSDVVEDNILSTQFPRALEKATFRQACLFMKNAKDAAMYEAEMMQSVTEANAAIGRRKRDTTGTRPNETTNVAGN